MKSTTYIWCIGCAMAMLSLSCSDDADGGWQLGEGLGVDAAATSSDDTGSDDTGSVDDTGPVDDTRPEESRGIIGDEHLDALERDGFEVYRGADPPDLSGTYYLDSLSIIRGDYDGTPRRANYWYTFDAEAGAPRLEVSYEAPAVQDTGSGLTAYASGHGQCFTVYLDASGSNDRCNYQMAQLLSGCLESAGIRGLQLGLVMISRPPSCDDMMDVGERRIIEETDDLAERRERD